MATLIKLREGETGACFHYLLPEFRLGEDEDGDPWTTCTVKPIDAPRATKVAGSAGDREFDEIFERCEDDGRASMNTLRGEYLKLKDQRDAAYKALSRGLSRGQASGRYFPNERTMVVTRSE